MTPTETLKHEHEIILVALDAAEREAQRIQSTGAIHADTVEKLLDFFPNFADHCHHAKEEKVLFPRMEERGVPAQGGPIGVMLHEHDQGRQLLRASREALPRAEAGDRDATAALGENLAAYARLLRGHISKENTVLFPMADRVFTPADQQEVESAFDKIEAEEIGEGVHDKYHEMAHQLAQS